jgi:hypothetical protein
MSNYYGEGGKVLEFRDLQMLIEKKRSELDKLVLTRITDLSTDDIVALSNELDHLIAIYINLIEGEKKP